MLYPHQEVLSSDGVKKVHAGAMQVLRDVGVKFESPDILRIFRRHGITVLGDRVYLTEKEVWRAVQTTPNRFVWHGRNPERSVTIGGSESVFAPGYGASFLADAHGNTLDLTAEAYHELVKLVHQLPNQDVSGYLLAVPGDVPSDKAHLHMLYAHILHSDKPFMGSVSSRDSVEHTLKMVDILFGDSRTAVMGMISCATPLTYSEEMSYAMMRYAEANQAVLVTNLAMAGSTAPITLAGMLAQQNAELLAGVVLTQIVRPGSPVVYGSTSTCADMQNGSVVIGSPEQAKATIAHAQMARYYGLPSRGSGSLTDSNCLDSQSGIESMMSLSSAANCGIDFILHSAGILSSYLSFSREKAVMDDEMVGRIKKMRQPLVVDNDTLALDDIADVGPQGMFLTQERTIKRCRTEFWRPDVSLRQDLGTWQEGRPGIPTLAYNRWRTLVATHQDPPLDSQVKSELEEFVNDNA